jgi:hypothetical protein
MMTIANLDAIWVTMSVPTNDAAFLVGSRSSFDSPPIRVRTLPVKPASSAALRTPGL